MKFIEVVLLITVFFLLRLTFKRMPARYWVMLEAFLFFRLLLPSFSLVPFSLALHVESSVLSSFFLGLDHTFGQIIPWISGILLLWGIGSYLLLLLKKSYPGEVENLYYHDGDEAYVIGLLPPKIFLPMEQDKAKKELLLLHEQMHVRRGDPLVLLLSYGILCFYWYNPLLWLLYFRMRLDMDLACDEALLKSGVNAKQYGTLLLEQSCCHHLLILGLRWLSVKERLKQMKKNAYKPRIAILLLLLMVVVLLPFLNGSAKPVASKPGLSLKVEHTPDQEKVKLGSLFVEAKPTERINPYPSISFIYENESAKKLTDIREGDHGKKLFELVKKLQREMNKVYEFRVTLSSLLDKEDVSYLKKHDIDPEKVFVSLFPVASSEVGESINYSISFIQKRSDAKKFRDLIFEIELLDFHIAMDRRMKKKNLLEANLSELLSEEEKEVLLSKGIKADEITVNYMLYGTRSEKGWK